ncbi:tRNA lysidine(34) synthetase TilS [Flavobacterium jejuense]|uniref:tRNA(Ile)-lysidine synthase n=1 Tax=Flavobacterium jejuense TaxID=1544455 RepID=A0ABX0IQJ7_9FLAO|nr:tRNA lysidine(34) synthetase TilS [Flavobacterium jejuense]NHN24748.1 tRNA lysidine(34) synthetase TilS [Flavobacterium jejuense]
MLKKIQNHLNKNFSDLEDKRLLLAVSGGIDSMVLLNLCKKLSFEIAVAHCNFQLRGKESDADENFVIEKATELQIPFFIQKFDTEEFANENKLSIQLAARKLRYDWFNKVLENENYDFLLTAHHLDDQIETFLINLARGTGLDGLIGIPAQNNTIIRPMLTISREEIENYAKENKILWREDASNASDKYVRNKIRHRVVPILKELNPSFLNSFQDTLEHLEEANTLVEDASKWVFEKVVTTKEDIIQIDCKLLLTYTNYKSYLYQWLKRYGFTAWNDIYELIQAQSGKQIFSNTHLLLKDRNFLILSPKIISAEEVFFIDKNTKSLKFPLNVALCQTDDILEPTNNVIFVDQEKLVFPLQLRKRKEGDYFYPSGMEGKKKLSKYFKDEKYSLLDKEKQWLLTSNDKIVWIIGKRADKQFLANTKTKNILKIELK